MAESSRCFKYGGRNESVPRHECSAAQCEFDSPEKIKDEVSFWINYEETHGLFPGTMTAEYDRKLEFVEKLAARLDKRTDP